MAIDYVQVEYGVLASMLHNPQWAQEQAEKISPTDFSDITFPIAKHIFKLMEDGGLSWPGFILEYPDLGKAMMDNFPSGAQGNYFLKLFKIESCKRKLRSHIDSLSPVDGPNHFVVSDLIDNLDSNANIMTIDEVPAETGEILLSGYQSIDKRLTLRRTHLSMVAGDAGVGKSALVQNLILGFAYQHRKVLIWTGEMSGAEYRERLERIHGPLIGDLAKRILILEKAGCTSDFRFAVRDVKPDVFVCDYLQLVEEPGFKNRYAQVGSVSRRLKQIAKNEEILVIAVSSLNRRNRDQIKSKPMLRDLKESSDLEYDGDSVLFIWRDPTNPQTVNREFILAKQRNGRTASWPMLFNGERYEFIEVESDGDREVKKKTRYMMMGGDDETECRMEKDGGGTKKKTVFGMPPLQNREKSKTGNIHFAMETKVFPWNVAEKGRNEESILSPEEK